MQRRRIHKLNAGKYQTISTEMRKKVIELVVNYSMSIKQVNKKFIIALIN